MKSLIVLMLAAASLFGAQSVAAAADRDVDRSTRIESDELRADIRQHRLKKVKKLDHPKQYQDQTAEPKGSADKPYPVK